MRISTLVSLATGTASLLMLGATVSGHAQEALKSSGWYKACSDQGENKICNVQYQAVASTGQVITSVNLAEITGKIERKVFQVTVPTSRMIPPGLGLKIGDGEAKKIPYSFCTPRICAAEVKLDDALVDMLKKAGSMDLVSVNWQGKENPINITLDGFTAAYDGEPIKREELAARQKKLAEELKEKSTNILEKLQEAQEKARSGEGTETSN